MKKYLYVIGIDEAGRGPIAGPVAVGVLCLPRNFKNPFPELVRGKFFRDSKQLSEKSRERIFEKLYNLRRDGKLDFSVSMVSALMIDKHGITTAISSAITRSLKKLNIDPNKTHIFLDGRLKAPPEYFSQETLIKGDTRELSITLASIAAKVTRDQHMRRQHKKYPEYGFERHKGYGTKAHYKAIKKYGISDLHRNSFLKGI